LNSKGADLLQIALKVTPYPLAIIPEKKSIPRKIEGGCLQSFTIFGSVFDALEKQLIIHHVQRVAKTLEIYQRVSNVL
jgi:hypothetical protein